MRGLDYLAELAADAGAEADCRPTIGDDATLARARARLAIYESILERLSLAMEEARDEPDIYLNPSALHVAQRELQKGVADIRRRLGLLATHVNVVLDIEYTLGEYRERSMRAPYILKQADWGDTSYTRHQADGRGYCGLRGTFHRLDAGPDIRLCKRCTQLALSPAQQAALEEAWRRCRTPSFEGGRAHYEHHDYDRSLYQDHFRINGRVF